MSEKRFIRLTDDRMFLGVASGLARYFHIDVTLVRLAFVIAGLVTFGNALLLYAILAIVMPVEKLATPKYNSFDEEEIVINPAN